MALAQINPSEEPAKGPSKLDNAAKVLGIMTSLAQTGMNGYNTFTQDGRMRQQIEDALQSKMKLLATKR